MRFASVIALAACSRDAAMPHSSTVAIGYPGAIGVERVDAFPAPHAGAHVGVDAVRLPRFDVDVREMRDDHLLVSATSTGIHAVRVDDDWNQLDEAWWPVPGASLPWSDLKVVRRRLTDGTDHTYVYYCSRGTNVIQISDLTAFPTVTSVEVPIDLGLPVTIRGAQTLQVHEGRGVLVLNGVDIGGEPSPPAPLSYGCAPAAFYDIATDPMAPRLLSIFTGEHPGDQIMFDSQFLHFDGRDVWAPTMWMPSIAQSYFSFYAFDDPAGMDHALRLTEYLQPMSGQAHNVVQLQPRPDGTPLLAAGFEAWAFLARPGQTISKAAVIAANGLSSGTMPTFVSYLRSDDNLRHAAHNPCSRLFEVAPHTYDTVPMAHFTGGYMLYEYGDDNTSELLAHVPISTVTPSGRFGRHHDSMTVPVWMACYNGAWDMVATWIGDYISCTDRECSFLVEPTYGFARQFGTYIARADGTVPRVRLSGRIPRVGHELRLAVDHLEPGGRVDLTLARNLSATPVDGRAAVALWYQPASTVMVMALDVTTDHVEFVIPRLPDWTRQLVATAVEYRAGSVLKTPAAVFRVRP